MDKSKFFSSLVTDIIIVAVTVAVLWGGTALIGIGDIRLSFKFCNFLGFIIFSMGVCTTIAMIAVVWFEITDPHIIKKQENFLSLVAVAIIIAVSVTLLWGGAALIGIGDIPLVFKFCNSIGFIIFAIGACIAILVAGLVWFDITDPYIIKKQEKRRIEEDAGEEKKKKLRSD